MISGGCHCGMIRFEADGDPLHHAICHCSDCRRAAGAPMVAWIAFPADRVSVTAGVPKVRASSEHARRHFCAECGTGLFYTNDMVLPGIIDIQTASLDRAEEQAPGAHIQYVERLPWTERLGDLPTFDRYPG